MSLPVLLQIAVGGALGAALRYVVVGAATRAFGAAFPWGTGLVNVAGSFLMGAAFAALVGRDPGPLHRFAPFLVPGLLGGFTTFSAFSLEAVQLLERGRAGAAALYVGGSVALGLLALGAGMSAARAWPSS